MKKCRRDLLLMYLVLRPFRLFGILYPPRELSESPLEFPLSSPSLLRRNGKSRIEISVEVYKEQGGLVLRYNHR